MCGLLLDWHAIPIKYRKQVNGMLKALTKQLHELADRERAAHAQRYFKTGPGEYAEGDRFIGVRVPELRKLARAYRQLPLNDIKTLLHSPIHEQRLLALLIMVQQFERGEAAQQERLYKLYLDNTRYINNWDLVDSSAPKIVGAWLEGRNKSVLKRLAKSDSLWERRIAILACFYFIQQGNFGLALQLAKQLLRDEHDLIHKAVGWMLREIGKRDRQSEEAFLQLHYHQMPRTMLRYAIERLPEKRRKAYLDGRI